MTSPDEINKMCFEPRIAVVEVEKAIRQAIQTLSGVIRFEELIIGVDPGKKPGIAVFANDEILEKQQANSSVECAHCLKEMVKAYSFDTSKLRIGHGAPESRKEILDKVGHIFTIVEIVDESRTTRRTRTPDIDAAISIAKSWKCLERIRNN